MSLIKTRMLKQTAVWWPSTSFDDYGKPIVATPIEISVRWEDVNEEFIDKNGTVRLSTSQVYVDRDVEVGGVLMLGELDSGVDEDDPKKTDGAGEIRRLDKFPNLRATEFLRRAWL